MEQDRQTHESPKRLEKTEQSYRPYALLCSHVVQQACRDYYHALRRRNMYCSSGKDRRDQYGQHINVEYAIRDCESFFRDELSLYSDLDGEWLISAIRGMVDHDD